MRYTTILLEKILIELIDQILKEKVNRQLEMMNHLNRMKTAWDNLASVHASIFCPQRLLDGVLNHFAERWWGMKTISMLKIGYE